MASSLILSTSSLLATALEMSPSVTMPTGTPRPVTTKEPIFDFSMSRAASTTVEERSMVLTFDVMMSLTNSKRVCPPNRSPDSSTLPAEGSLLLRCARGRLLRHPHLEHPVVETSLGLFCPDFFGEGHPP